MVKMTVFFTFGFGSCHILMVLWYCFLPRLAFYCVEMIFEKVFWSYQTRFTPDFSSPPHETVFTVIFTKSILNSVYYWLIERFTCCFSFFSLLGMVWYCTIPQAFILSPLSHAFKWKMMTLFFGSVFCSF